MNLNAIPAELRERPQWVVWKTILRDGERTKPPFNPNAPTYYADHADPRTWGTFEQACKAFRENPSVLEGIGYVFSDTDEYFGIDIDDERKVNPEYLDQRRQLVNQILANVVTYTEVSPSGTGLHLIGKGRLPSGIDGKRSIQVQIEVYQNRRFFTITGDVFDGRQQITGQQDFLDELFGALVSTQVGRGSSVVASTDVGRRVDLSDEEVIRLATNYSPSFAPRFNAQIGCEPGEWSETFMAVVGIIDRFTGLVDQVERIIYNSPMVLRATASRAGESRLGKAQRNLHQVLRQVRAGNNGMMQFIEHGRQQYENMQRAKAERAAAMAEQVRKSTEAMRAGKIWEAFPMLDKHHKALTYPPGIIGEFVKATEAASHKPFTKFAIPATLACLAGVIGRKYKLNGNGINLNFILAAPSNTGKTMTTKAWSRFLDKASAAIGNSVSGESHSRFLKNGASSVQGIFSDFMEQPSLCWMIDECATQLKAMSNASTPTEQQLRDGYNELFDCAFHGAKFTPPRSVQGKKADWVPINNLSVSTYWTTTTSKFDVSNADALDGFLSRVTIIRHDTVAGQRQWGPEEQLPPYLHNLLFELMGRAKQLDECYKISERDAMQLLVQVSTDAVTDLQRQIIVIVDGIADLSLKKELPPEYIALARLPMIAERIAAVMAVVENPNTPAITPEQFLWAFGYVMQNAIDLLDMIGTGEIGAKASDEMLSIVRSMTHFLQRARKGTVGVAKGHLRKMLSERKPFKDADRPGRGPSVVASEAIKHALETGILSEIPDPANANKTLLSPTSDPIWE